MVFGLNILKIWWGSQTDAAGSKLVNSLTELAD